LRILIISDINKDYKEEIYMQEERLQVLKMVDEGKINVDEAAKLLEALKATGGCDSPTFEEKFKEFCTETKEFFKETGTKVNELYEKAKPKVESAAKAVVAKTADIADNISQSLNEKIKEMDEKGCCGCPEGCCETASNDNGPRPE